MVDDASIVILAIIIGTLAAIVYRSNSTPRNASSIPTIMMEINPRSF